MLLYSGDIGLQRCGQTENSLTEIITTLCAHRIREAAIGAEAIAAVVRGGGGRGLHGDQQRTAVAPQAHPGGGRLQSQLL